MFGTVAHLSLKPGAEDRLQELVKEYESLQIPGHVATHLFRMDADRNDFYMTTVFESRDSYFANANSPEQDARYRRMLDILVSEPEWHDGEVIYSQAYSGSMRY